MILTKTTKEQIDLICEDKEFDSYETIFLKILNNEKKWISFEDIKDFCKRFNCYKELKRELNESN